MMARLRGEGGCPWDREQTRETLRPFLVEETYEVPPLDAGDGAHPQEPATSCSKLSSTRRSPASAANSPWPISSKR
jgi:hypothetical protein